MGNSDLVPLLSRAHKRPASSTPTSSGCHIPVRTHPILTGTPALWTSRKTPKEARNASGFAPSKAESSILICRLHFLVFARLPVGQTQDSFEVSQSPPSVLPG